MPIIHHVYEQPSNLDIKLWRYTDLEKFIYMLETKSLYFSRLDFFDDPFEGSVPKKNILAQQQINKRIYKKLEAVNAIDYLTSLFRKEQKKHTFANCWHMSDVESAAMWKNYAASNKGIAIQTTYKSLWDSLPDENDGRPVYMGLVNYINFQNELIEDLYEDKSQDSLSIVSHNPLKLIFHKSKSFESENEVRIALVLQSNIMPDPNEIPPGIEVPIGDDGNMDLIHNIYIAPFSPNYKLTVIKSIVEKFNIDPEIVHRSTMDEEPLY